MKAQLHDTGDETTKGEGRGGLVAGAVLVGCGLVLLAGQVFTLGAWPLVLLGLIFTAAGVTTHTAGWFIPGGVLNGIGLGALLVDSGLVAGDPLEGGVFLLCFAAGWLSIFVLSKLFTPQPMAWTIIPAIVMAAIGAPLLLGAAGEALVETALGWLAFAWPLALIAAGIAVLVRRRA
jgi:hypothetical protein